MFQPRSVMKTLSLIEHNAGTYGPRTWINAGESQATCAFAVDFETAGERLTRKAAGVKYTHVDLKDGALDAQHAVRAARTLYRFLNERDARVLNVAGNGIYTLSEHGISQARIDLFLTSVISKVHEYFKLSRILCGGQTGADLAGSGRRGLSRG